MSVAAEVTRCDFPVVGTQPGSLMLLGSSSGLFPSFCSALGNLSISKSLFLQSKFAYLVVSWIPGTASVEAGGTA